ncbi:MAG TPA: hypothetical protein VFU31_20605, partial [Candidatus Binatia bacterium]|nr:hypothetical protein [Candidatus Binatia bacterium]
EATEAAAALPTFSYRPGNGLNIEAADKSWALRSTLESHFRMLFESGRDQVGRTNGEIMGRRFRPGWLYCINNCLWELEATLDLDGFATNTGLQRGALVINMDNINPFLPSVQLGMEVQNAQGGSLARQGSGAVGAQAEYDLHTRNNGFNTGRAGQGVVLNWDDKPLFGIGTLRRFQLSMSAIAEGDDGTSSNTDRKDFNAYMSIQPFSQIKNKWISGLTFEYGSWFCNVDNRAAQNGCNNYQIRDHGDGARQVLFQTGGNTIGDGLHIAHGPGIVWSIGPYTMRAMGHFQRSEDRGAGIGVSPAGGRGRKKGQSFLIGHDLFLWSPKGFLTGNANTPGSILVGTHFERVDMSLGCNGNTGITCASVVAGGANSVLNQFHRNRVLLREWDLFYFVAPRMSIGIHVLWYDASNLNNARNQAAHNLGICKNAPTNCRVGRGGDWVDGMLNWRYTF